MENSSPAPILFLRKGEKLEENILKILLFYLVVHLLLCPFTLPVILLLKITVHAPSQSPAFQQCIPTILSFLLKDISPAILHPLFLYNINIFSLSTRKFKSTENEEKQNKILPSKNLLLSSYPLLVPSYFCSHLHQNFLKGLYLLSPI